MLSVLHHVIYYQGLDAAREIVAALAGPGTRFVVELARGDEDRGLPWSASQPADPYAPFDAIPGGYDADVIGTFETHLSTSARDLVLITPRRDHRLSSTLSRRTDPAPARRPRPGRAARSNGVPTNGSRGGSSVLPVFVGSCSPVSAACSAQTRATGPDSVGVYQVNP